jgi:hypothetical protein
MARTPELLDMRLQDLMLLLSYRWAAVQSSIGELGDRTQEEFVAEIDRLSKVKIRPSQLADLVYHMKEVVFEKVQPAKLDFTTKNHNAIMRRLKQTNPEMFKTLPSGEVVMHELEERVWDE